MQTKADEVRRNEVSNESVSSANDSIELKRQELQIKERVLAAQEKANSDRLSETLRDAGNKKTAAIKKAQNKVDAIFDDCIKLAAKLDDLGDPEEVSDLVLGRAMRDCKSWNSDLDKIDEMKRSLEDIAATNELSEEDSHLD